VLDVVWLLGTATVREVVRDGKLWQTYPTIITTMNRLFKKGFLNRVPDGMHHLSSCCGEAWPVLARIHSITERFVP
jgi:predicted transcriptional regulator